MTTEIAKLLCCLPRGGAATRALVAAGLTVYGFSEDKRWARWVGIAGLTLTGLEIARCYFRAGQLDEERAERRPRLTSVPPSLPAASDGSMSPAQAGAADDLAPGTPPQLRIVNDDEPAERPEGY